MLSALDDAGVALGDSAARDRLVDEAAHYYFWVEYRLGPAAPWTAVHPAFGRAAVPDVAAAATYAGDIPAELTHRVRIELVVDQRIGNEVDTTPLMNAVEFPSANVGGQSMMLALMPDTLLRDDPYADDSSPAEQARFVLPLVNGQLPEGALALALNGVTVPPDAIEVSAAGVFKTVGDRFERAASALLGLGGSSTRPEDIFAIEALRLQITLIHPQESERRIERVLCEAPGDARLAEEADETTRRASLVAALAHVHSLTFVTGALSPAYALDRELAEVESLAPLIRAWSDPSIVSCNSMDCIPKPTLDVDLTGRNAAAHVALLDREAPVGESALTYRDAPTIVRLGRPLFPLTSSVPGVFDIGQQRPAGIPIRGRCAGGIALTEYISKESMSTKTLAILSVTVAAFTFASLPAIIECRPDARPRRTVCGSGIRTVERATAGSCAFCAAVASPAAATRIALTRRARSVYGPVRRDSRRAPPAVPTRPCARRNAHRSCAPRRPCLGRARSHETVPPRRPE